VTSPMSARMPYSSMSASNRLDEARKR
jgi:hypothetical protein